ncbi:MAG: hypothetical protein AVDCRST_MAG93-5009 [uncultured Chloroflexia bacterium]|uniref:Uncharacterized protein n=1 Tax=uncultured Chloroflexia bacterium TaxID=1672391 RepID=A0A6J4KJB7_9CHLR|nr:MAG: hypothetical protein AVDCRST_MAG93-5009 [uncultured Chloroflexia bacterium]
MGLEPRLQLLEQLWYALKAAHVAVLLSEREYPLNADGEGPDGGVYVPVDKTA